MNDTGTVGTIEKKVIDRFAELIIEFGHRSYLLVAGLQRRIFAIAREIVLPGFFLAGTMHHGEEIYSCHKRSQLDHRHRHHCSRGIAASIVEGRHLSNEVVSTIDEDQNGNVRCLPAAQPSQPADVVDLHFYDRSRRQQSWR